MVAERLGLERGLDKGLKIHMNELYDGMNKTYEEYNFDTYNALTYQAMIGKSVNEREAAAAMMQVLRATETLTSDETRRSETTERMPRSRRRSV